MTALTVNFVLLGVIFAALGVLILIFPKVLDVLVASLLLVAALVFLSIAYHVHSYKKKGLKIFDQE